MYKRKTYDVFEIHGWYFGTWKCVTIEETYKEAKAMLKCYDENEPTTPHRIVKRRIPYNQ